MQAQSMFKSVASVLNDIHAASMRKSAVDDPGSQGGSSSHQTAKLDDPTEVPATEGSQSAWNSQTVKETVPDSIDSKPDATAGNTPSVEDGRIDDGKTTGKDPANESPKQTGYEGDKRQGGQGGTSHVASGDLGEKYSSEKLASMSLPELYQLMVAQGNQLCADIAASVQQPQKQASQQPAQQRTPQAKAAAAGAATAAQSARIDPAAIAAEVLADVVKTAHIQADLIAMHLASEAEALKKQAEEEMSDPTGPAGEGDESGDEGGESNDGAPTGGGEGEPAPEQLLAAMGAGGAPGMGGPEMGGPEMGGPGGDPGMGAGGEEEAIQQLAMALMELGIDPAELIQAVSGDQAAVGPAQKIASVVTNHKRSGRFRVEEAKTAGQRSMRDYMKRYVSDLVRRGR